MCNQIIPWLKYLDQLLFIIRSKDSIGKSQVIKVISQTYNIIGKIDTIFITTLTRVIANNISKSILHTTLAIDIQKIKEIFKDQQKIDKIWHNKITIIVDIMSMMSLDLLTTMD